MILKLLNIVIINISTRMCKLWIRFNRKEKISLLIITCEILSGIAIDSIQIHSFNKPLTCKTQI